MYIIIICCLSADQVVLQAVFVGYMYLWHVRTVTGLVEGKMNHIVDSMYMHMYCIFKVPMCLLSCLEVM